MRKKAEAVPERFTTWLKQISDFNIYTYNSNSVFQYRSSKHFKAIRFCDENLISKVAGFLSLFFFIYIFFSFSSFLFFCHALLPSLFFIFSKFRYVFPFPSGTASTRIAMIAVERISFLYNLVIFITVSMHSSSRLLLFSFRIWRNLMNAIFFFFWDAISLKFLGNRFDSICWMKKFCVVLWCWGNFNNLKYFSI